MSKFSLSERFRLELHWNKAVYEQDGVCVLKEAIFTGPALSEALQLNNNDFILLDFFKQYFLIVNEVYVGKFSWEKVTYNSNGTISLDRAILSHDKALNKVPKLKDNDYLIIDTSNHEVATHQFNPVYKTYVVNEATTLYKFGR